MEIDPEEWNQDVARDAAREGMNHVSTILKEEWDDVSSVDQYTAESRDQLISAGIDLSDDSQLWTAAIIVERVYAMMWSHGTECEDWDHISEHLKYGLAPLILSIDSAIKNGVPPEWPS